MLKQNNKNKVIETVIHIVFLLLGLVAVGFVLLITVYLIISGIPAIRQIGLFDFLFGKTVCLYERSKVCVERTECLRSCPFVLKDAQKVHHLVYER